MITIPLIRKFIKEFKKKISELYTIDLENRECPVIILARSLGGHIMSNYIWDMQKSKNPLPDDLSSFERLEYLAGMITFGCNIPVFAFAHRKIETIDFPGKSLSDDLRRKAKWLNYYDPSDILGYPLKAINDAYDKIVHKDIPINVGSIFKYWNLFSHTSYWTDNNFTKPVSEYIGGFL